MKKKFLGFALAFVLFGGTILLSACGTKSDKNKLQVFASFYPLYEFVQRIGGDKVEVQNISTGADAHGASPTVKQMAQMSEADLIVINGAGMESWVDKLGPSIKGKVLDTSLEVNLIDRIKNGETYDNHEEHTEENHDHEDDDHNHGPKDPHIWLSLKNAVLQLKAIKDKLSALDPQNANYYNQRFMQNKILFEALDEKYETTLSAFADKYFVVSHRAFGYLAYEYDLNQYSLSGVEADKEPDAKTMKEVVDFMVENNINYIFYHSTENSKGVNAIVNEANKRGLNAQALELATAEYLTQEQKNAGDNYLSLMALNLYNLQIALA